MKPDDLLALLAGFYRDKAVLAQRHEAGARLVSAYDVNNAYQNVINRDDTHLAWLDEAIGRLGGALPGPAAPPAPPGAEGSGLDRARAVAADDAALLGGFVARWREPVERVTNAREKLMLRVILGESLEHQRMFEQAAAGRTDLLGRRADGAGTGGGVLPARWVE